MTLLGLIGGFYFVFVIGEQLQRIISFLYPCVPPVRWRTAS